MDLPRLLFLLGLFFGVWHASAFADAQGDRALFLKAERALATGHREEFERLRQGLKDYPLRPYLDFAALRHDLRRLRSDQVDAFLKGNADTPLAPRLRRLWVRELARRGDWHTYLKYAPASRSTRDRCQYLDALIRTGHQDLAFRQVPALWRVGRSQPKACDPVFAAWRSWAGLREAGRDLARALGWARRSSQRSATAKWSLSERKRRR